MDEFWWAMILVAVYTILAFMWIFTLIDLFGRLDLGGWGKAGWLMGILFVPVIGVIAYFVTRPDTRFKDST